MAFYSPDIVKLALAGGSIENLKTIAQVKQSPVVFIINTPLKTEKEEIKVTLKIEDQGWWHRRHKVVSKWHICNA